MKYKRNSCIIPIDRVGRLVLPMSIRSTMMLNGRNELVGELNSETGELTLRPIETRCRNCGAKTSLHHLGGIVLCDDCIEALKNG